MPDTTRCPEAILAAIPWYPDGLSAEERGAVEAHAADCRACRAELSFLLGDDDPGADHPDERVYARLLERLEPEGAEPLEDRRELAPPPTPSRLRRFSDAARGPVSMAAGLLVALVSGMLTTGVIWTVRVVPTYETASAAPRIVDSGLRLQIVFEDDATAAEMKRQLLEVRGSVVSGPTPRGVYRVELGPGIDVETALEKLRSDGRGVVALAEPAGL